MSSDKARKQAVRAIMTETGMKYMAAMRELERREAAASGQAAKPPESVAGAGLDLTGQGPQA